MYDILILGAGPAGISAGIYAVSRGQKALVLEQAQVGGIIGKVPLSPITPPWRIRRPAPPLPSG